VRVGVLGDAHQAKAGTHTSGTALAGPPLQGAQGVKLSSNPPAWVVPSSANYTSVRIQAGSDLEATLCLKCHSSWWWGSGTAPTSPGLGEPSTDQAREFNPSNVSFHPVLADCSQNVGRIDPANLNSNWNRTANINRMTCSDCHASDSAADPRGPHGAASKFMLKGPNTAWDGNVSWPGNRGLTGSQGIFCFNCHDPGFANTRFGNHLDTWDHGMSCQTCHSAVPHGGPRPGFLVAGSGVAGGPTYADWDSAGTPYNGGSGLYINYYPGPGGGWGQDNCGCGGSDHSE